MFFSPSSRASPVAQFVKDLNCRVLAMTCVNASSFPSPRLWTALGHLDPSLVGRSLRRFSLGDA